jgi:uncharacterized protein (DUF952 family)
MRILFKILDAGEWASAAARGQFDGSAIDLTDGFIHLSAAHQVRETARRHFAGRSGLVLAAFAEADLDGLKWEASRGGDLFPHVYGSIATARAIWVKPLPLEDGVHRFPDEAGA